jgi:iron complex outermembrane receptor protein
VIAMMIDRRRGVCRRQFLLLSVMLLLMTPPSRPAFAAAVDTAHDIRPALTDTVFVIGYRAGAGEAELPVADGDHLERLLQGTPFATIRRGSAGVADLYADGFKRQDITVTVDGERFVPACPNRMDTRVGQVDLLDIETAELSRNGAGLQSGLGGQVDLHRRRPGRDTLVYGRLGGAADHAGDLDASLAVESRRTRLAGRLRRSDPTTDADGRTYAQLYGYADAPAATVGELRTHRAFDGGDAQAAWESSRDVLFPYLQMDERSNDHYQLSGSYRGLRAYFNRTDHLMDNALRTSWAATRMVTDAATTMLGAVGGGYEVYTHHWTADNRITPAANPAAGTSSRMLPDVWRLGATASRAIGDPRRPWLRLRAGLIRTGIDGATAMDPYRLVQPDAAASRWSFPCGAVVTRERDLAGRAQLILSGEVAADAPGVEQQYIAVDKPGTTPDWVGNPRLADPARATLRVAAVSRRLKAEVFGTHVWHYPTLVRRSAGGAALQTYAGVDALLAGAYLSAAWDLVDAGLAWNWGEQTADDSPLAEIPPLSVELTVRSPKIGRYRGWAHYRHAAGQGRVDISQGEWSTGAWNRLDLGATLAHDRFQLALDLENATNALYVQHLSYQRSPFAAGTRVHEPGRTLRVTTTFAF